MSPDNTHKPIWEVYLGGNTLNKLFCSFAAIGKGLTSCELLVSTGHVCGVMVICTVVVHNTVYYYSACEL